MSENEHIEFGDEQRRFDRRNFLLVMAGAGAALLAACSDSDNSGQPAETHEAQPEDLGLADPVKKQRGAQITSTFENSTTEIQYGYAENIGDGRGITAGRDGFTSRTGDLLVVVERYKQQNPGNKLERFLPALHKVLRTDSTAGLEDFITVWGEVSRDDPEFHQVQDKVHNEMYFAPALRRARRAGVKSSLGQQIIVDTIIQHGGGDDPDGLPQIMKEVTAQAGTVKKNEAAWLQTFLDIRQKHLENAFDKTTRKAWRESVSRVDALRSILDTGNLALDLPLQWTVYGDTFKLTD